MLPWGKDQRETGLRRKEFSRWSFYYGWIIVGVALVSMAFWFGIRTTFSVLYVALLEDFSWSRGEAAGVYSMALVIYMIMSPLVGGLIDRFGPRRVIVPGILLMALGLMLCASIRTLAQLYLVYGVLVATGVTCISIVSYTAILAHWFEKRRGTASGLAVSGMGLGTFLLVPLSQYFISLWGWRLAFVFLGGLTPLVLMPLNIIFLRHKPQDLGLHPDGHRGGEPPKKGRMEVIDTTWSGTDWTIQKALRRGRYWALLAMIFLAMMVIYIVIVHSVSFLVDQGIDKMTAAFVLALVGIISSGFRIFWGWLSDRIGREMTYSIGAICICLGLCSFIVLEVIGEKVIVYPFIIFFGTGWGVTAPMFMAVAADLFQGRGFGLIYGICEGVVGIAAALGAWVAGFIFDQAQSYQWAFILCAFASIVSALFVWMAAPRKVRRIGRKNF